VPPVGAALHGLAAALAASFVGKEVMTISMMGKEEGEGIKL
jgi:hypothetical protein